MLSSVHWATHAVQCPLSYSGCPVSTELLMLSSVHGANHNVQCPLSYLRRPVSTELNMWSRVHWATRAVQCPLSCSYCPVSTELLVIILYSVDWATYVVQCPLSFSCRPVSTELIMLSSVHWVIHAGMWLWAINDFQCQLILSYCPCSEFFSDVLILVEIHFRTNLWSKNKNKVISSGIGNFYHNCHHR